MQNNVLLHRMLTGEQKRAKKNGKAKVVAKKANRFKLSGKYIFYNKGTKLYRIKKDGTGKAKLLASHCNYIEELKEMVRP